MHQAKEGEIGVVADAFGVETRKQSGGRGAVKALVVEENPDVQR
jgi:hypothetical protein